MTNLLRFVVCCSLLLTACGNDNGDGAPPPYASGVSSSSGSSSSSTPVSNLDESDQREICSSLNAYVETYVDVDQAAYAACLPQALVLGRDTADCNRRLDDCMALAPTRLSVQVKADNVQACLDNVRRCDVSVAQLEGCVNVNVTSIYDILDWSCERIDDPNARSDAEAAMHNTSVCSQGNAACGQAANVNVI